MSDATVFRTKINSIYPRCVDGRHAEVFLEWSKEKKNWEVVKRDQEAREDHGPQFLGASLLFVRALEEVAGWEREQAFEMVEKASAELGWGMQVHFDDHHGDYDFLGMSDEEIISHMEHHHTGCGFAKYAWNEEADEVIIAAKQRHWRLQLLVGAHNEKGAVLNYIDGETFATGEGVNAEKSHFNTDVIPARKMFDKIGEMIHDSSFAKAAEDWMIKTYTDVVIALNGVKSADEIAIAK